MCYEDLGVWAGFGKNKNICCIKASYFLWLYIAWCLNCSRKGNFKSRVHKTQKRLEGLEVRR